ncbi:MAG TPA: NAD(P)H-dependent oxidoreductase, partial [Anaerolineae bacterium]|nr:NAD(P)H-dependent oxidoreductase [Anaerolineae bacterium]
DDLLWLLDTAMAADGLILSAPIYFLAPSAAIKLVLDRLLMLAGRLQQALPLPRPALTIATAGLYERRGVALPYLNALAFALGYRPIDSLLAIAPGPGEVLLDEALMRQVLLGGRRVGRGELEPAPTPTNVCPTCRGDAFVLDGSHAVCPICGQQAEISLVQGGIHLVFGRVGADDHHWDPEALHRHIVDWVVASGPRFLARREEIKARRAPFREVDVEWVCPPRHRI